MLERNRGARRDRTRRVKARRLRSRSRWQFLLAPRNASYEAQKIAMRAQRRFECRDNLYNHRCGDCFNGGPCDWCYGGTFRKQQRLRDALAADFAEWNAVG